jgi:hypothetical protein
MKTNVRDTSIEAYHGIDISAGQAKVVAFLLRHPGVNFTRGEISALTGIPINSITGRVHELIQCGVLEERVRRACKFSGKQCHPVRLAPVPAALPRQRREAANEAGQARCLPERAYPAAQGS